MTIFEQSLEEINQIFGRDIQYAFSTIEQDKPFVRIVDGFFLDGSIYLDHKSDYKSFLMRGFFFIQ